MQQQQQQQQHQPQQPAPHSMAQQPHNQYSPQRQQPPLPPPQAGAMGGAPRVADQHRNALLGMFKKVEPQSTVAQQPAQHQGPVPASNYIPELSSPSQRRPPSEAPVELALNNLLIQPGNHHQQYPQASPSPRSNSLAAQSSVPAPYCAHPSQSHQPMQPSPLQQQAVLPPTGAVPGGSDQKRQLLSLFGNAGKPAVAPQQQARSPLGGTIHEIGSGNPASRDVSRSRLASLASVSATGEPGSGDVSRRGSQTPISPADESFLLGYLQSVTNTASR